MRRLRTVLLLAGAWTLASILAVQAMATPRLSALKSVSFPDRAFVLSLSKPAALTAGDIVVLENGLGVDNVSLVPATLTANRTFGVILVIDASNSMKGAAISDALAAARAFARHRTRTEALGVITFNRSVRLAVSPTTDPARIDSALRVAPPLAEETSLYDAAVKALAVLRAAKIAAGSVVLLTDGADTHSHESLGQVVTEARAAGVRVFAVGLRSPQYKPEPLQRLAAATGATYAEAASPASLKGIYASLSEQLAREYLLRYRSLATPTTTVRVTVAVAGQPAFASASYRTPTLPEVGTGPFHRSLADRFISSTVSMAAISLVAALLVALAVSTPLRRRRTELRRRVGEFVAVGAPREARPEHARAPLSAQAFGMAERVLERMGWWERFREEVEIAEFPVAPAPLAVGTAAGTLLLAVLLGSLAPVAALFALALPVVVRVLVKRRLRGKRERFADQLPDNLLVLAASLRAGHSFAMGLSAVVDEAEEPSRSEFRRAIADEQLGVPIEEALVRVSRRMDNADLEQVALVAALQRETGGNTAEVLDTVAQTVRERFELRGLVRTLTAEGRMSQWILTGLPIAVALIVTLLSPGYLKPLFTTRGGETMLGLCIALWIFGFVLIRRILDIEL
jgi:tight adherence protein B